MFREPVSGGDFGPTEEIDFGKRYLVKCVDLSDEGVSQWAKDNVNPEHSLKWVFRVAHADTKQPLLTGENDPWELWQFSSNKTGKGNGKTAKARMFMEGLLGRELSDEEVKAVTRDDLIGKVGEALFDPSSARTNILRLSPHKEGVSPAPELTAPAPKAKAQPMPQAVAVAPAAASTPW